MPAAKGVVIRPSAQAFRVETSFTNSTTGALVTTGTASASVFEVEQDGTLRAVDFSTTPPSVLGASATVPTTGTIALTCQSCAGNAQPYWSATFAGTNLTVGGVYLITFTPPSGASTPSPKVVQFGSADGDNAPNAAGQVSVNLGQTGLSPRDLGAVADAALTVGDALVAAVSAAAGKESVSGTTYLVKTPSTGTVIRTFTLDSGTAPTQRN